MAGVVKQTLGLTNGFDFAAMLTAQCSQIWPEITCSQLRNAVMYSYKGNLGRRGAAMCAAAGACDEKVLYPGDDATACRLSLPSLEAPGSNVTGRMDLCTMEGIQGGKLVPGIQTTTSKW
jgi:hypothetical protein